jgi:hypothetical protein
MRRRPTLRGSQGTNSGPHVGALPRRRTGNGSQPTTGVWEVAAAGAWDATVPRSTYPGGKVLAAALTLGHLGGGAQAPMLVSLVDSVVEELRSQRRVQVSAK